MLLGLISRSEPSRLRGCEDSGQSLLNQFMSEQSLPRRVGRHILALAKNDVVAQRKGARLQPDELAVVPGMSGELLHFSRCTLHRPV
jgi:hypothetical protein